MRASKHIEELAGEFLPAPSDSPGTPPFTRVLLEHDTLCDGLFEEMRIFCGVWPDGRTWCYRLKATDAFSSSELRNVARVASTLAEFDIAIACALRDREEKTAS